jgi:hypothetical protein
MDRAWESKVRSAAGVAKGKVWRVQWRSVRSGDRSVWLGVKGMD